MGQSITCDVCDEQDINPAEIVRRIDIGYNNPMKQEITKLHLCGNCSYNLELFIDEIGGEYVNGKINTTD